MSSQLASRDRPQFDQLTGPEPGPTLGVVAGVHGDEVVAICALEDWLAETRLRAGRVLAVTTAHPAALRAGTRRGSDDVDLNRVFPGDDEGPTASVARRLAERLLSECDALLTLHSWSRSGTTVPYVEVPSRGDSAVVAESRRLAAWLGVPWIEPYEWEPGLLPAAATRAGIPAAELEVGGLGRSTPDDERAVRTALTGAASAMGLIPADPPAKATRTARRHWLTAPVEGRVRMRVQPGEAVPAGTLIAEIVDHNVREPVVSPVDGTVAIVVTYGWVPVGAEVVAIFADAGEAVHAIPPSRNGGTL